LFHVLGFNETWICSENGGFTFAGAVSNANLSKELCLQVTDAIRQLVPSFNLKGLCSLDFIVEETGQYSILELNPRPTATFELYEDKQSLFVQHLAAFNGTMPEPEVDTEHELGQGLSRALRVLYARKNFTIPRLQWPGWVNDRPKPGKSIASGEPICTICAAANSSGDAKALLKQRETMLKKLLGIEKIAA